MAKDAYHYLLLFLISDYLSFYSVRHRTTSNCSALRLGDISQDKSWGAPSSWFLLQDDHTFGKSSATGMGKDVMEDTNQKKEI